MSGSVSHLGGDRYRLRIYVSYDPATGKNKYASRMHRGTPASARKALRQFQFDVQAEKLRPSSRVTVNALLDAYISSRELKWSPRTLADNSATVDRWVRPQFGTSDATRLKVHHIESHVHEISRTYPRTALKVLSILRTAFNDGIRLELVDKNPASLVLPPRSVPAQTSAPALDEVKTVIEHADPAMAVIIRLAAITGARRGEILALQWRDFNLHDGAVVVSKSVTTTNGSVLVKETKTGRVKVLALDPETLASLRQWRVACVERSLQAGYQITDQSFLFARGPDGSVPWWPDTLTSKWRTLADAHGLTGVRFHDVRHAVATTLLSSGIDPKTAADRLGNDPALMLRVYSHAVKALDQESANLLARALDGTT